MTCHLPELVSVLSPSPVEVSTSACVSGAVAASSAHAHAQPASKRVMPNLPPPCSFLRLAIAHHRLNPFKHYSVQVFKVFELCLKVTKIAF